MTGVQTCALPILNNKTLSFVKKNEFFMLSRESLKHLRSHESGQKVPYKILRKNKIYDFDVTLANFGIQTAQFLLILVSLSFISLGLFLALKRPKLVSARITGLGLLVLGLSFMFSFDVYPYDYDNLAKFRALVETVFFLIGTTTLVISLYYFPQELTQVIKNKWNIRIPLIICLIGCIDGVLLLFSMQFAQITNYVFQFCFILLVAYPVIVIIKNRKTAKSEYLKTMRFILIALTLNWLVVIIRWIFALVGEIKLFQFAEYGFLLLVFIPIAYIYTTWRYRLLDIEIRIRRNIQYNLISGIWRTGLLILLIASIWLLSLIKLDLPNIHFSGTTIEVLSTPLRPELEEFYHRIMLILLSFAVGFLFLKLGLKVQKILDKKYYRVKFDYRYAVTEISEMMSRHLNLNELASNLVCKIGELLHLKRAGIVFIKDQNKFIEAQFYGFKPERFDTCTGEEQKSFVNSVAQFNGGFKVEYLPGELKTSLTTCQFTYCIPVKLKDNLVGCFLIGEKLSETPLQKEDFEFLASIASHTSVAIENALLYEDLASKERLKHELEIARRIQIASLPQEVPNIEGLDISGLSLPAHEVGGDFYDFLNGRANDLTIVVGDVSGKGTSAALYMSKAQGILRTLYEFNLEPGDLMIRTNHLLYKYLEKSSYITAIGARIDAKERKMKIARAGHLPLYAYRDHSKSIEIIVPKGIGLGLRDAATFIENLEEVEVQFQTNDVFLFISDGITDARNENNEDFGDKRLIEILWKNHNLNSMEIRDELIRNVNEFVGSIEQFDDITVVVVKVN